jgi:hypothetical protein
VLYGNANHIDEQDGVIEPYPTEPWDIQRLAQVCFLCQPAVFFRRRIVEQHGGLDQRLHYCMDYEYWLRLSQRGVRFHYLPESLSGSRLYGAAKTLRDRVKVHREINCMMRQRLGRVPERWLFNYAHSVLDTNGVCRSRKVRFALGLMVLSWYASLRWNRRLSRQIIVSTTKWMWESSVQALRGCRA